MMRYKLITLPKNTTKLPLVQIGQTSITHSRPGLQTTITPTTVNISNGNIGAGYTCVLSNSNIATISVAPGGAVDMDQSTFSAIGDDAATSVSVVGRRFIITSKTVTVDTSTTITIVGNETGGSVTIPYTVKKDPELDIVTTA